MIETVRRYSLILTLAIGAFPVFAADEPPVITGQEIAADVAKQAEEVALEPQPQPLVSDEAAMFAPVPDDHLLVPQADVIQVEINKGKMVKLDQPIVAVVIADPNTADVQVISAKLLFVRGKKVGETSIYAIDAQDNTVWNATIETTHNLSKLNQMVKEISPDSDISFRSIDGGMVMEGFTPSAGDSENIRTMASTFMGANDRMVDMVKTSGSDQVTLQVKIVEMSRTDIKRFGINMRNAFTGYGGVGFQLLQGSDIELDSDGVLNSTITEVGTVTGGTMKGFVDRSGSIDSALLAKWRGGKMNAMLDALETQGLAHVLAEPTLTTTSGKTASFLAGGEFPIPINSGNNSISVEYKPFGVGLNFTPVVISKNRISIRVAPEVSTLNFDNPIEISGIKNPIVLTRKAEATVELGSGQTFALAGLLKNDNSNIINKFPGLGNIPILGALFRSTSFQNDQTELVILVTPYIVRPVDQRTAMKTPVDGYQPPSDLQRILLGSLYQQEPMQPEAKKEMPSLHGAGGFILE